jgi:tetratricopeptide (TPR) repeat protein
VISSVGIALWTAETLELRAALADELSGCAAELRDPAVEAMVSYLKQSLCIERGDLAGAKTAGERWLRLTDEIGQPTLRWLATYPVAGLELLHGRLRAGERLAEQAFQIGQESAPADAAMIYGGQLLFVRAYQGRANEIIEMAEQSVRAYPGIAAWRAGLAAVLCWLDRHDEASPMLDEAAGDRFEHVAPSVSMLGTLALYADAAAQTRNVMAATPLYERIEPFRDQVVWLTSQGYGHVRLWLGLLADVLGRHAEADAHLGFACDFHEANDSPLWAARGHLGWAEALAARGDAAAARELATRALELSREHGYGAFESRAATLVETESAAGA